MGWHGISRFPGARVTRHEWERTWRELAAMGYAPQQIPQGEGEWEFEYPDGYGGVWRGSLAKVSEKKARKTERR